MNTSVVVRWLGVALIIGGGLFGVYGLVLTSYAPLSAAWWGFNFNIFWGGIAALIAGVGVALGGQYLMDEEEAAQRYEEERRQKHEIPA